MERETERTRKRNREEGCVCAEEDGWRGKYINVENKKNQR